MQQEQVILLIENSLEQCFDHIWVLPEVVHTVFVTDPFKATVLIMIAHPMLHCRFLKVYVVLGFLMSNLSSLLSTGWYTILMLLTHVSTLELLSFQLQDTAIPSAVGAAVT